MRSLFGTGESIGVFIRELFRFVDDVEESSEEDEDAEEPSEEESVSEPLDESESLELSSNEDPVPSDDDCETV